VFRRGRDKKGIGKILAKSKTGFIMEEKYQVNDFGKATFIAKKNWKYETECYGIITAIDAKCIEFTDNDGNVYIILKSKFKFEKAEFVKLNNL
jgi:hypothetical protein